MTTQSDALSGTQRVEMITNMHAYGYVSYPFLLESLIMKFTRYIATHHVFTTEGLLAESDSENSARKQLKLALGSGKVERVRRGLYASHAGRFEGVGVDPYEVVTALDPGAVLSYHTALEALGVAHNVAFECRFRTNRARAPFSFGGVDYVPHPSDGFVRSRRVRGSAFGSALATTREQTVVDCLKRPEWSGGIEEAVRSLSALPYVDSAAVAELACADSASLAARAGWLLEAKAGRWRVPDEVLELLSARCSGVTSKLDKRSSESRGWSRRWRMTLPETEEEVRSWVS